MSLIRSRLAFGCKPARYASASFSSTSALAAKYRKTPVLPSAEKRIQLPPIVEWKDAFPSIKITRGRVSIANEAAAQQAANAFVPKGSRGKTVIEVFPESKETSITNTSPKPLEQADPRLKVIHWSGMDWESYEVIKKEGLLDDIKEISWDAGGVSSPVPSDRNRSNRSSVAKYTPSYNSSLIYLKMSLENNL
ncbi:hypothetical protein AAF712_000432 [Marasmius tenuissimus]|uniref:Uncharacterized protein n=1 Tax=Marasmius tenuissimus TaxID=585030 RepID=A0ABR3AIA8_9AGAR